MYVRINIYVHTYIHQNYIYIYMYIHTSMHEINFQNFQGVRSSSDVNETITKEEKNAKKD